MLNKSAADAYRVATYIAKIYTRLGVALDAISLVLDEAPLGFDDAQFKRINDLRNAISREMGLINDFSNRESHRICNTEADPAPPVEVWVTQDLVPDRPGIDQWRWVNKDGSSYGWHHTTTEPYHMHGYIDPDDGTTFEVRCRRKDLPTNNSDPAEDQNRKTSGSDPPAPPSKKDDPRITVKIEVVTHNGSIVTSEHSTDDPSMTEAASLMGYCLRAVDNYLLKPRQDDAIEAFENSAFQ